MASIALLHLFAADRSYGWDAAAVFLDRGDSRPPSATELRADLLFLVFGACFLFWGVTAGAECAAVLHDDPRIA